jgi:hypothetical protein
LTDFLGPIFSTADVLSLLPKLLSCLQYYFRCDAHRYWDVDIESHAQAL